MAVVHSRVKHEQKHNSIVKWYSRSLKTAQEIALVQSPCYSACRLNGWWVIMTTPVVCIRILVFLL